MKKESGKERGGEIERERERGGADIKKENWRRKYERKRLWSIREQKERKRNQIDKNV